MSTRFFRFLVVGVIGFAIDSGLTLSLITSGFSAFIARPPAIVAAMAFTWLANRSVTFGLGRKASLSEALRYSTVAVGGALLNYLVYAALIAVGLLPLVAIVVATLVVAIFSYMGYKHYAFRVS